MSPGRGPLLAVLAVLLLGRLNADLSFKNESQATCVGEGCLSECSAPTSALFVPEEVVLVLGNSGVGKSALVKLLSRHDKEMVAVQKQNNDFLIEGDGIGSSVESVTSVPELFSDNDTSTNYFDCPGFEDTRAPCVEVTTTYYMKDIARHARRVKVLLLTPYFAVRSGQDRSDFVTMLKHAARVLKNPSKMTHSLALVVTKVQNPVRKEGGRLVQAPDSAVVRGVADFLGGEVRSYLRDMQQDEGVQQAERVVFANALNLVDILLADKEDGDGESDYSRIGLFHSPDEEGAIDKIQTMRDGRTALLDLVLQRLRYADVRRDDFGFTVSERTSVFALDKARKLTSDLVALLNSLSSDAVNQFQLGPTGVRAYDPNDIRDTQERYAEVEKKAVAMTTRLKNSTDIKEFCRVLDFKGEQMEQCVLLDVLQTAVSDQPLVDMAVLAAPMDSSLEFLSRKKDWYSFLLSMYQQFNSYRVQRQRWSSATPFPTEAFVDLSEFSAEAQLVSSFNASGQNMSDLSALLSIVSRAPQVVCSPAGRVVVQGESVLLSEAVSLAGARCPGPLQLLEVYALNTVFVDDSLTMPGAGVAIIAPRWEILGSPSINLDGQAGERLDALPNAHSGQRGQDGAPGNPGHPGGLFLGVGLEFVGGKVAVSARGGAGGPGQDGGPGGDASDRNGGDGGDGGAGGLGGLPGRADVVHLSREDATSHLLVDVSGGDPGQAGRGGLGGEHRPQTTLVRRRRDGGLLLLLLLGAALASKKAAFHAGARGGDGVVTTGRKPPHARTLDPALAEAWDSIPARVATYLRHNENHPYLRRELRTVLSLLENDDRLDRVCHQASS